MQSFNLFNRITSLFNKNNINQEQLFDFNNLLEKLNNNILTKEEYINIIDICENKINSIEQIEYTNKFNKILENIPKSNELNEFISNITNIEFDEIYNEINSRHFILFNYKNYKIELSHTITFENDNFIQKKLINVEDTNDEYCYNFFTSSMNYKFLELIGLDNINVNEFSNVISQMFEIFENEITISW